VKMNSRVRSRSDAMSRSPRGESRGWQIGPRIRIGGTVGKIGEGIKKVLPSPGQIIGGAALGPIGASAGGLIDKSTSPLQHGIQYGVDAVGAGLGAAALAGGGAAGGAAGGTAGSGAAGAGAVAGTAGKSALDEFGSFLEKYGGDAVAAAAAYANYQRQQQSDKYAKDALSMAQKTYGQNQPLRDQGRADMLNPSANTPDLSAIRSLATAGSGNPFTKVLPMASIATKPGATLPMAGMPVGASTSMAPQHPLTNPVPSTGNALQLAPSAPPPPAAPPARAPLQLAPRSPALATPPTGLQPSRAVLPFAYE
jgi:hypothetical protein